ncbi:putative cell surface glycoprotein MUC18 [Penaeus vannamei]|uniref:Putative cell surface glycoprotein MUC18 n=1 Tax=Penaeus vannamei TaxID=6689 RepID=A0A3R7QRK7_PENVA|nr:putative cell surface glycoprotein MUC18 [Penaeus vannamei]
MVWALNGGRAELPCAPDPRVAKDSPQIVLWYRASNTTPVYSYDARSGEFEDGERWTDGEALGKRAYFSVLTEPPVLVLDPAHARDEGVYKCRVDYRYSSSTYRVVNLTIVAIERKEEKRRSRTRAQGQKGSHTLCTNRAGITL